MLNFQFSAAFEKIGHSDFWKNENKKSRNENRISGQRVWAGRATCVLKKKNTERRRVGLPRRKSWVIIQIAGKKGGAPSNSIFPVDYQKFTVLVDLAKDNHQHTIFPERNFWIFAASNRRFWSTRLECLLRPECWICFREGKKRESKRTCRARQDDDINIVRRPLFLTESGNRRAGIWRRKKSSSELGPKCSWEI